MYHYDAASKDNITEFGTIALIYQEAIGSPTGGVIAVHSSIT